MKNRIITFTAPKLSFVVDNMMKTDWSQPRLYADFMAQIYYYVCHTTRILGAAGARFPLDQQKLHIQCMHHAGEEQSHELLSLNDVKAVGFTLADFTELQSTKSLYRSAYYLIEHCSPMSIVGYAYFLEKLAVDGGVPLLEMVEPIYGKKAVRHLHVHTKEDPGHIVMVEEMLNTIPKADVDHVEDAIATAAYEYNRMIEDVKSRSTVASKQGKKAA